MTKPRVPAWETKASKPLAIKTVEVAAAGETPSLRGESVGEAHRVLEWTQIHPPRNQHLKGHNPLVESEGSNGKWGKSRASDIISSLTPPSHIAPQYSKEGCLALANT